jgi:hypothetical protein
MDTGWLFQQHIGWWRYRQEFAGTRQVGLARGSGEQAVVADAVEPAWQKVEQGRRINSSVLKAEEQQIIAD